ncbi:MAG: hypothetical protein HQL84_01570 [Magnetococcales bacterium]|nr:hypothetical protein [Magnetococcales bacterium]MBF0148715.1 hypothetical protein [Magnetococcales bacterium]MBF0173263.1 hypothetical protein [Magnetococcales bacterium]MBF0630264.1 hypothetical protein [Magnetococcales bacterium]
MKQKASFSVFELALEFAFEFKQDQKRRMRLFVSSQNQNPGGNPADPFFLSIIFQGGI